MKKNQETFDLCDSSKMPVLKHTSITALRSTLRHTLEHINLVATMRHRVRVVMSSAIQSVGNSKATYSATSHAMCSELVRKRNASSTMYENITFNSHAQIQIIKDFETWLRPWIVNTSRRIHKNSIFVKVQEKNGPEAITLLHLETQLETRLSSMCILNRMLGSILSRGGRGSSTPPCVVASRLLDELVTCLQRETMLRGVYSRETKDTPYHTLLRLFQRTAEHYLETLDTWMIQGKLFDPQNESFLAESVDNTYSIRSDGVPRFMQSVAHMVLETGVDMKVLQQMVVSRDREDYGVRFLLRVRCFRFTRESPFTHFYNSSLSRSQTLSKDESYDTLDYTGGA